MVEREFAERGTQLSNGLWMREVRERSSNGMQSSILSNDRRLELTQKTGWKAAPGAQENLLKYMPEHSWFDRLIAPRARAPPAATLVVHTAAPPVDPAR